MLTRSGRSIARITLSGGGRVEITLDVDLFRLSPEDRAFITEITDHVRAHNEAQRPTAPVVGDLQ